MLPLARSDNPLLTRLNATIRADRPPIPRETQWAHYYSPVPEGLLLQMWFLTGGCRWDGCTMCNYGKGPRLSAEEIVAAAKEGLDAIDRPVRLLDVSPSGSMLDPGEVPPEARREIFALMARVPGVERMIVETRAETVTDEILDEMKTAFGRKRISVELGLESSSPWVLRYCVNKGGLRDTFVAAAQRNRSRGIVTIANVSLGIPFLNAAEQIDHAVETCHWAHQNGADMVAVFPVHTKTHTLAGVLHQLGAFAAPSLWALAEVLKRVEPRLQPKTIPAWYRPQFSLGIVASPDSCPHCKPRLLELLDEFRMSFDPARLTALQRYDCACKEAWRESLGQAASTKPLPERVADAYDRLAAGLDASHNAPHDHNAYWQRIRSKTLVEMSANFAAEQARSP